MEVGRRGRGRGILRAAEDELHEEIRVLSARLEAVEVGRCRDLEDGDDNDADTIATIDGSNEKGLEIRLLKSVLLANNKLKPKLSNYDGNLSTELLLDWISELDNFFECEDISDEKRIIFATMKLKGHLALWWDSVQAKRRRSNKPPIKKWDRMVAKLKGKFLPKDYQIALHR